MSTEHMQLSEPESSHESEQLQSSAAESEIVEDDNSKNIKKWNMFPKHQYVNLTL